MQGEVGRMLVCGSRDTPMGDEEITFIHSYLIDEWKINDGVKGDRGDVKVQKETLDCVDRKVIEDRLVYKVNVVYVGSEAYKGPRANHPLTMTNFMNC